ncbi:TPA: hypothetical protein ACQFCQ_001282 [Escherichia coli]
MINNAQSNLLYIKSVEAEIKNSVQTIVNEMIDKYKSNLIGKKVRCWDYTFKHWYDSEIVKVDVNTDSNGLINGIAYIGVLIRKGTPQEWLTYHNIEHVKFLED